MAQELFAVLDKNIKEKWSFQHKNTPFLGGALFLLFPVGKDFVQQISLFRLAKQRLPEVS